MRPNRLAIALVLVTCVLAGACSDTSRPSAAGDIRGEIFDAGGRPVPGATIVLQFAVDPPLLPSPDKPRTGIGFTLPVTGAVRAWIGSFCDADTVRLLLAGILPAGAHLLTWDGRNDAGRSLPDGVYWAHIDSDAGSTRLAVPMLRRDYAELAPADAPAPLAVTDVHGRFAIGQGCLPFGFVFTSLDEDGSPGADHTFTRSVRVWAFSEQAGAVAASDWVEIDAVSGAGVVVHFPASR